MIFRKNLEFPLERLASITKSYIEILRHFGFYKLVADIINKSSAQIIRVENKKDTMIHIRCGRCRKTIERSMKAICEKCNKYMLCAYWYLFYPPFKKYISLLISFLTKI